MHFERGPVDCVLDEVLPDRWCTPHQKGGTEPRGNAPNMLPIPLAPSAFTRLIATGSNMGIRADTSGRGEAGDPPELFLSYGGDPHVQARSAQPIPFYEMASAPPIDRLREAKAPSGLLSGEALPASRVGRARRGLGGHVRRQPHVSGQAPILLSATPHSEVAESKHNRGGLGYDSLDVRVRPRKQCLYFPEQMIEEMREAAVRNDRSLSWTVQTAWRLARKELATLPSANSFVVEDQQGRTVE